MDAAQIDELRRWGEKLSRDDSQPELRSAGRAILLLIAENERLRTPAEPPAQDDGGDDEPPSGDDPYEARSRQRARRATGSQKRWFHNAFRLAIAGAIIAALVFATLAVGARVSAPSLDALGPPSGAGIGPALLPTLKFSVGGSPSVLDHVHWRLDGRDVTTKALPYRGRVVFDGSSLKDGHHVLTGVGFRQLPGLEDDEGLALRRRHQGPRDRVRRSGGADPVRRPAARARDAREGRVADGGRPPGARQGRPLLDRVGDAAEEGRHPRRHRHRCATPRPSASGSPSSPGSRRTRSGPST